MIRQAKKEQLINTVMGSYTSNQKIVSLVPGKISFEIVEIENDTKDPQTYKIVISDQDSSVLEGKEEVTMVYQQAEYDRWKRKCEVGTQNQSRCLIGANSVHLQPGEKFEALLKFQTFRETSQSGNVHSSEEVIKQRYVKVDVMMRGGVV